MREDKSVVTALTVLRTEREITEFLRALLTEPELDHLTRRWEIFKALSRSGASQREVKRRNGGSWEAIRRVAATLADRRSGAIVETVLTRLDERRKD
jgi:Trp operon repressor